jgi:hypothetical protein
MAIASRYAGRTAMRRRAKSPTAVWLVVVPEPSCAPLRASQDQTGGLRNRWNRKAFETALEERAHAVVFKSSLMINFDGSEINLSLFNNLATR